MNNIRIVKREFNSPLEGFDNIVGYVVQRLEPAYNSKGVGEIPPRIWKDVKSGGGSPAISKSFKKAIAIAAYVGGHKTDKVVWPIKKLKTK